MKAVLTIDTVSPVAPAAPSVPLVPFVPFVQLVPFVPAGPAGPVPPAVIKSKMFVISLPCITEKLLATTLISFERLIPMFPDPAYIYISRVDINLLLNPF